MKKFIVIFQFLFLIKIYAIQNYEFSSAESAGTATAFNGMINSPEVIFFNPANFYNISGSKLSIFFNKYFTGFESESGINENNGYFPVNVVSYGFSFITPAEKIGGIGLGFNSFNFSKLYSLFLIYLSASFNLNNFWKINRETGIGINLKYLSHKYSSTIYDKNTDTLGAISFDAGLFIKFLENFNFGFSIIDLTSTDTGISSEEKLLTKYRAGILYDFKKLEILADFEYFKDEYNLCFGAIMKLTDFLILKTGLNFDYLSFGLSYDFYKFFTINYAMNYYISGFEGNITNHKFSLNIKF